MHGDESHLCGVSLHKSYGVPFVSKFITDGNLENINLKANTKAAYESSEYHIINI